MTENQFDEFFRKKLHDYESSVPEDTWKKIEQRKEEPRRRIIFWWSIAAVFLICGTTGGYFLLHPDGSNDIADAKKKDRSTRPTEKNNSQTNNKTLADSTTYTLPEQLNYTVTDAAASYSQRELQKPGSRETITGGGNVENTVENNSLASAKKINGKGIVDEKNVQQNAAVLNNQPLDKIPGNQPVVTQNTRPEEDESSGKTVTAKTDSALNAVDLVEGNAATVKKEKVDSLSKASGNTASAKKKKEKYREPKEKYIEVYASPDYAWKQTSGPTSTSDYGAAKKSAEQLKISYSVGLRYTQMLTDHFFVKTGLQYSQVNELFKYRSQEEYRVSSVIVARTIPTSSGSSLLISNSSYRQAGYHIVENINHYSSLDLPLLLGYKTGGSPFNASVSAGVIFNLSSWYNGFTIDSSYRAADIKKQGIYKKNTGMSLYFSIGLAKQISTKTSLFAEPYLRYRLGNMTKTGQPFQQKINIGGLSLGLRYRL